jgi:hypothetical protein
MNLQVEKIQLAKKILDTDNKSLLKAVKTVFKEWEGEQQSDITTSVAKSIEAGMKEVKHASQGKVKLKSAKDLLNEL